MRNKMLILCTLFIVMLAGAMTYAGDYTYNSSNGYYWKDGQAFTRTRVKTWVWRGNCRYAQWTYQWDKVGGVYSLNSQTEGWRSKMLEIAATHKKYQDQMAASANEHQEFLETAKELGITGIVNNYNNFQPQYANAGGQYGGGGGYGGQGGEQYAMNYMPTAQGATLFGYREVADIYGNVNLGELYSRALRLREQSAGYESLANKDTTQMLDNLGARAAAIEEMRTKADLITKLAESIKAESTARVVREYYTIATQKAEKVIKAKVDIGTQLMSIMTNKCVKCHNATKQNGGLRLDDLSFVTDAQTKSIIARIDHVDPLERMPLEDIDTPGIPLSADEKAVFFLAAFGAPGQPPKED